MRRVLFCLFVLVASFQSKSQVILNEIYSDPGDGKHEFFELYNTSTTPVSLDCYTLVAYYNTRLQGNNVIRGFIVINLPQVTIPGLGYFTGASTTPFNVQSLINQTAGFSWSSIGNTGYIRDYRLNSNNQGYDLQGSVTNTNDIFRKLQNGELAVLLYNGTQFANGIQVGLGNAVTVAAEIRAMPELPPLSIVGASCGTSNLILNLNQVNGMESASGGQSGGSDNGFAREFDGACGTWVKTSNSPNHTPGRANVAKQGVVLGPGVIDATEKIFCGRFIDIAISSGTNASLFNVQAQLFIDVDANQRLSVGDVPVNTFSFSSASRTTTYTIPDNFLANNYIIVYRTAQGCVDHVSPVVAAVGSISTTELRTCDNKIYFRLNNLSGDALGRVSEVSGTILGVNAANPNGVAISTPTTIAVNNNQWQIFDASSLVGEYSSFRVQYTTGTNPFNCFGRTANVALATGTYPTIDSVYCGRQVSFVASQPTGDFQILPFTIKAYLLLADNGTKGVYEPDVDELVPGVQPINVTSYTTPGNRYSFAIPIDQQGKSYFVAYETPYPCYNRVATPASAVATLNTIQESICGANESSSTVTFKVDKIEGGAFASGYPIKVDVYYDLNLNGVLDQDEKVIVESGSLSSLTATGQVSIPYTDRNKDLYLVYTATNNCFNAEAKLASACRLLPVKFSYFTARRNAENKKQVQLEWETTMEQNNKGFYIQRMTKGEWEDIGFVNTAATDGNSNVALKYRFADVNLFGGTTYYRMYQVDFDGKADYSEVKSVDGQGLGKTHLVVYPNPASGGSTTVVFATDATRTILLVDATGRVVQQWRNHAGNRLALRQLQPGLYTLKVSEGNNAAPLMEKIIVQ